MARTRSRRRADEAVAEPAVALPDADTLVDLKLSPEVAWYLVDRGYGLPEPWQVPLHKTPEPGEVSPEFRFDPARVDRVLAAFRHLRHTKGRWAGMPLVPDVWQIAYIIAPVFGWVKPYEDRDPDIPADDPAAFVRVITELYVEVSRKNGKSTLIGGLGLYMTCADGEQGAECVTGATSRDQAGYVFAPVKVLASSSPALRPYARALANRVVHKPTNSYFQSISSAAETQHGANIHFGAIDELHVHKKPDLVEAIETGTGSRAQPLIALITTADEGKPDTIYVRKRTRIVNLASRTFDDPGTYGVIWAAADSEEELTELGIDPFSEEAQRRANPGYGVSPGRAYLASAAKRAEQSPADLSSYLRLHLGVRTKQRTTYIRLADWSRNESIVDLARFGKKTRTFGGLDLANTSDFTAWCLLFPDGDGGFDAKWRYWIPEGAYDRLVKRTSRNAEVWRREGRFKVTDGDVVDDEVIVADVLADAARFNIVEAGYDPWNSSAITNALTKGGMKLVEVRQGYASLSPPLKELQRLVRAGQFRHGGDPVTRWMINNLAVRMDEAGNVKPDRVSSADKIDGVAAATIALARAMTAPTPKRSAYEDRGLQAV